MATKEITEKKTTNVVVLSNKRKLEIKPTKLKYFTNNDFGMYLVFKENDAHMVLYSKEGRIIALKFLSAVFDKPYETKEIEIENNGEKFYETEFVFDKELEKMFDDEINLIEFKKIIDVVLEVNGIDPN